MSGQDTSARTELLVICTGNAARSVMAGYMLGWLADERQRHDLVITTAGTLAVDGQPMSLRTRAALATIAEMAHVPVGAHRSRQLLVGDLDRADLVVGMEADHTRFVRRRHPQAADRTATIRHLCRYLESGPEPLAARVKALQLDDVALTDDEDVTDPAGGDEAIYIACAGELWALCRELIDRL